MLQPGLPQSLSDLSGKGQVIPRIGCAGVKFSPGFWVSHQHLVPITVWPAWFPLRAGHSKIPSVWFSVPGVGGGALPSDS